MMRWLKIGAVTAALALLAVAVFVVPTIWFKPWSIDHFFTRTFVEFALERPQLLSQLRLLEPMGLHFHSDDLDDYSPAFAERQSEWLNHELRILKSYDRRSMNESTRLSAEILEWFMKDQQDANTFMFHGYPVTQMSGVQTDLPDFMINTHSIDSRRDAENYIARVSKFGVAFDQTIEDLRGRAEQGIVAPRFILAKALAASRAIENAAPRENILYLDFQKKVARLGLDASAQSGLLDRLERTIVEVVQPAYARLNAEIEAQMAKATDDAGVWKLPNGDAYYAQRLHSHTTTRLSADSIHALGLQEVDRITDEMREILRGLKLPSWNPIVTLDELSRQERFHYAESDSARDRILADYKAIIDDAFERSKALFHLRPEASVEVRPVPEFKQATAPGAYYVVGALDGTRPGVFYVNLVDPSATVKFQMRTLAYHEAVPGHHFQLSIQQELTGVPFFRKIIPFTAYTEGWGLYAEQLALENGFHPEPYDRLGALQAELFRAVRLVVDTGIHRKHWTREQAIDYMVDHLGTDRDEIVREVERYVVLPGQACAYKIGELEIMSLRSKAQRELGDRFELEAFHDAVLGNGAVPLEILDEIVDNWIEEQRMAGNTTETGGRST